MESAPRRITDSPWFWAYLFGTTALIALALISSKYNSRQVQIEREFQGRQRAAQNLNGQVPSVPMSSAGQTMITLRPLFFGLAAVTLAAWIVFWRTYVARQRQTLAGEHRVIVGERGAGTGAPPAPPVVAAGGPP